MRKNLSILFYVILSCMCISMSAQETNESDADTQYATELLKQNTEAPDFTLNSADGKPITFSQLAKGKYTVIDFWASWCPDCRRDMPNLQRMYQRFAPNDVQFLGVSFDTDREAWQRAIEKYGIAYPQVSELKRMGDADIARTYGIKWIPSMYLIDPQGKVVLATVLSDKLERTLLQLFPSQNP